MYSCGEDFVYGGVVGGLDAFDLQKGPQAVGHLQQQLAGAYRFGPRRLLASELGTGTLPFRDGRQIANHVRPAQLTLLQGEIVVDREAIAHHNPAKGIPQQLDGGGGGAA